MSSNCLANEGRMVSHLTAPSFETFAGTSSLGASAGARVALLRKDGGEKKGKWSVSILHINGAGVSRSEEVSTDP